MNLGSILSSHIHPSARRTFNSHGISTSPVDADDDDNLLGSDATLKPGRGRSNSHFAFGIGLVLVGVLVPGIHASEASRVNCIFTRE